MPKQLLGKLTFVTGAGSGIGRSTCRVLRDYGAKIIAADHNFKAVQETAEQLGSDVTPLEIDVSSLDSVKNAVATTCAKFNTAPSVLVNCAGIMRNCDILNMTEHDYDDVYSVNLKGSFLITQQFAKAMIEHNIKGGSIVNFSSIVAKMNNMDQSNYAATKSGVISLTEVASKEFGKFGIRVNVILPGLINTPMMEAVPDEVKQQVILRCPLGRLGEPSEIAEVVAFLASQKSSYVNGAAVEVGGGLK